jgi:hypothetical protein
LQGTQNIKLLSLQFSSPQRKHRKFLCTECRMVHETVKQVPEVVRLSPHDAPILTTFTTDVTHRWMRNRCSKGFLEQGASSLCFMASNTVTRQSKCPPAGAHLYTSLAPPPPPVTLSPLPGSLSFLEKITHYSKKNPLLFYFHPVDLI